MKGYRMTQYKYDEIKSHFEDWIKEQNKEWITDNIDDLHHHCFNTDYYIIGTYEAKKWLEAMMAEGVNPDELRAIPD